ncbi:hypothetical protein HNQ51_000741 [Inhella inkyongensis]|uniref:Uncharacterized protein n=1 Tax=Inhella inkyongensis TaxID=392593 RepID=A0A840S203_9BURK|nr:hypothetical protein [Inhella inkyongensis]
MSSLRSKVRTGVARTASGFGASQNRQLMRGGRA